jgi:hypothetical protein
MRGGARPGAGRPKGSGGKKAPAVLKAAAASGILPREVMIEVMRRHYAAAEKIKETSRI